MNLWPVVKKMTMISVIAALILAFSGCSWNNWPWSTKTEHQVDSANQKLDTIAVTTDVTNQQVSVINKRLSVIEQRMMIIGEIIAQDSPTKRPPKVQAPVKPAKPEPKSESSYIPFQTVKEKPVSSKRPVQPVMSPENAYAAAYLTYQNRDREAALDSFKSFLKNYPTHELADNAQYWIGETYYDGKMYPEAIQAFKQVVSQYPDKGKAPAALLKIGYAYLAVDNKEKAGQYFRQVVTDYPFSDLVGKARAKLQELQPQSGPSDAFPSGS